MLRFGEKGVNGWNIWMVRKDGNILIEVYVDIEKIFRLICSGGKEENNVFFDGNDDESFFD